MQPSDEHKETIVNKIEDWHELELEALRRAGVAKEKEQGLEIESTEAVRLFREGTGYILRLRDLRDDVDQELANNKYYHSEHIVGLIDDYNRILEDISSNDSFRNCISSFQVIDYTLTGSVYKVKIGDRTMEIKTKERNAPGISNSRVQMAGTEVELAVLPRLSRLSKDVEDSLIGRCASGK
jgi:hypothetical protein